MYQVTFSEQSMSELNKLDTLSQMSLVESITQLTPNDLHDLDERLGKISRKGKTFYRLRADEYRIYFEVKNDILFSHVILDKNSMADFIFRTKLPFKEEQAIEQHQSFWQYLETLMK
ncbi:MAG: cytotoxic translational repressor of toxin-antitoxin stability system [Opitutaceae bacterium]|nr:cytotoxic translational repressor of toxin-antitoxin stability system [Opitutaceae bacterium]|tara:strand:- start:971 stop:1321 length:351 start_codon:yes stop_codon:yes gene_type:complete